MTITVRAAGCTNTGLVRARNEDAHYVGERLFAVADGLGGHPAGDVASATVIDALRKYDRAVAAAEVVNTLGRAVAAANTAIGTRIEAEPTLARMGSTLVAMLVAGETAAVANIGDSRIYLHRDGTTRRITEDHVLGRLVADAADRSRLAGRLTRFIDGRADGRSPDLTMWELRPGDRFLLCSDGLTAAIADSLIHGVLDRIGEPGDAVAKLVDLAVLAGGPDNVTAVLVDAVAGD